ncbi:hypothetical protein RA19_23195 [Leisingera sp. ANG-M1]|uniref:thioesterase family protein n=1 Tax=Leisingera sp. ANG-M1 TaxID=1577895 RepID=UPI00057DB244|nr:thioesterase family protein [Leisingera sp. ANG-M1]KIC07686.1 hypothetical protein RA19_23195 [Leisingera sp. ANG-M1]
MTAQPVIRISIDPTWIDAYGHLNEGYYLVAFSEASWPFQEHIGLGETYTRKTSNAIYTVESRISYLREVTYPADLTITNHLLGAQDKKIWSAHVLSAAGEECCRLERISLNYNQASKRVAPFPKDIFAELSCFSEVIAPDWVRLENIFSKPRRQNSPTSVPAKEMHDRLQNRP